MAMPSLEHSDLGVRGLRGLVLLQSAGAIACLTAGTAVLTDVPQLGQFLMLGMRVFCTGLVVALFGEMALVLYNTSDKELGWSKPAPTFRLILFFAWTGSFVLSLFIFLGIMMFGPGAVLEFTIEYVAKHG